MRLAAVRQVIEAAVDTGRPIYLGFSGGKESVTLASLCEPWRNQVKLFWVNTGDAAPHMAEFVRGYGRRFELIELRSPDRATLWREQGIPADIVPIPNMTGLAKPRMQPWFTCCYALRTQPMVHLLSQKRPCILIHGQRQEDPNGALAASNMRELLPPEVDLVAPLFDWSGADVMGYLNGRQITLPVQYREGFQHSIECLTCPTPMSVARLRFLDRHYPKAAVRIRRTLALTLRPAEVLAKELRAQMRGLA